MIEKDKPKINNVDLEEGEQVLSDNLKDHFQVESKDNFRKRAKKNQQPNSEYFISCASNPFCCTGRGTCRILCFIPRLFNINPKAYPRMGYLVLHAICLITAYMFMHTQVRPNSTFFTYLRAMGKPSDVNDPVQIDFNSKFKGNLFRDAHRSLRGASQRDHASKQSRTKFVYFNATRDELQLNSLRMENPYEDDIYGHQYYELSPMLRMTLALCIFQTLTFFVILPRCKISEIWHDGCWTLKLIIILSIWISLFSIDLQYLIIWVRLSAFGTYIFLFAVMVITQMGSHRLNSHLQTSSEKVQENITYLFMALTLVLICGCFYIFTPGVHGTQKCGLNVLVIIFTFFFIGITVGLKFRDNSTLAIKSVMACWFTILLWNALADQPSKTCNNMIGRPFAAVIQCVGQLLIVGIVLIQASIMTSTVDVEKDIEYAKTEHIDSPIIEGPLHLQERTSIYRLNAITFLFQFILVLAPQCYFFIFFNWGSIKMSDHYQLHYPSVSGFLTKIIFQWCCFGAYFLSQMAYAFNYKEKTQADNTEELRKMTELNYQIGQIDSDDES